MTFERYFYIGLIALNVLFGLINVILLLKRKKRATTEEEKNELDDEILNVTSNIFNYLHAFCAKQNIAYDFKKIKKQTIKSIKKENEKVYEKIGDEKSLTGQESVPSDSEQNS